MGTNYSKKNQEPSSSEKKEIAEEREAEDVKIIKITGLSDYCLEQMEIESFKRWRMPVAHQKIHIIRTFLRKLEIFTTYNESLIFVLET